MKIGNQSASKGCDILTTDLNKQLVVIELKNTEDRYIVQQLTHYYDSLQTNQPFRVDLGEKGKSGILQSMPTRTAFLSDLDHRIRFVHLPKHSSWLNQIECWFSILVRRRLNRGQFTSTQDLRQQILDFIAYFNRTLAKPFNWKFKGFPEPN